MAKRIPRVTDPAKAPHNAVFFDVWRLTRREGTKEDGRRYSTWKQQRMTGGVGADGRVSDRWLIEELSPESILQRWGSGRFRVRYLGASGELVGAVDWELQATPGRQGEPLKPGDAPAAAAAPDSPASRLRGLAGTLDGAGVVELMMLLSDARESATRQANIEADRRAARDQQFFDRVLGQMTQHTQAPAAASATAPAVDMARELALIRRELTLTMREESARLRAEVLAELPEEPDGPETFDQALQGAGVGLVEGVGAEVPSIVSAALARFKQYLQASGQPATPQAIASVLDAIKQAAAAEADANGVS